MTGFSSRRRSRVAVLGLAVWAAALVALVPSVAQAHHMDWWVHDHSSSGVPPRPSGLSALVADFGPHCGVAANGARSYWPVQSSRTQPGYVYVNTYIGRDVDYNIRNHISADHADGAVDYGVYGYDCRYISGTTTWSAHAFGAAVDTNSARNPQGQGRWNGMGADGIDHGTYIPSVWKGDYPGHHFYWGLNFSNPDPMHFQYVTNY